MMHKTNNKTNQLKSFLLSGKNLIPVVIIIILMITGKCTRVNAQTGTAIPYQGVARNAAGNIVANQAISLRLSILQGSATTGTLVYQETHNPTTNSLGLFNVYITGGTATGTFDPLKWQVLASLGAFIKVEMDINGGTAYIDMGTTQLMSVPFALYAGNSGTTFGAVTYKGTWNASVGTPPVVSSPDNKGFYYVVSVDGNTPLDGITEWNVGDWAIYNGTVWQKVDNSQAPVVADNVAFIPTPAITATNVQDAIEELSSAKVNKAGDTMTGDLILHADPTAALGAVTKQYADATQTAVNSKVNRSGDTMTGDLILHADPTAALGAVTKQYADATQTAVNSKVNRSGDTMTGDLILHADPTAALGAATKQYADAIQTTVSSKVNRSGDTMTGDLILNADPTAALGAVTKQYADAGDNLKADKVAGATNGHIAALNATGNLVDGGEKAASNISFTPTPVLISTNVQDAIEETNSQFYNLLDSYINKIDDGVTVYPVAGTTHKRFGIGDTAPECPLGVKSQTGDDDKMIAFTSGDGTHKWNINLNPSPSDVPGFSIDNSTTGTSVSRLFIDQSNNGNVGIGTITPSEKLHIESSTASGITGLKILNTATANSQGWKMGHLQDAVTERDGAFAILEEPLAAAGSAVERITVLPSRNVGINEVLPYATLHVSRPAADPLTEIDTTLGTGIMMIGETVGTNIVLDNHQIQARQYDPAKVYVTGDTQLGLQPLGGGVIFHGSSSSSSDKAIITHDGKLGLGTITPAERIDIDGAIKIGTTITGNAGTIRWSGSDFEGYDGSSWKSFTLSNWAGTLTLSGAPAITYNPSSPKVGIGVANPSSALDVHEASSVTGSSTAMALLNSGSTSSSTGTRTGLNISCSGSWSSSNPSAKNIGLYISDVSGQANANANIGALINGNVVVGDVTSSAIVGTNGSRVLSIQNGTAPTSAPGGSGLPDGGIQIFSSSNAIGTSVFNVMTGDGTVIQLYRSPAITTPDNSTINSTYGTNEQTIIDNMRTRINQLEQILISHGLLN